MKIPEEVSVILTRFEDRGYPECQISTWLYEGKRRCRVEVLGSFKPHTFCTYESTRQSVLACCRDIERKWKADQ